jgi:translation initiation factor IF-2
MSDVFDPYGAFAPSRPTLPTAYYFLRNVLLAGALAGGLFALYRNDVFLELAQKTGQEGRYLEFEKFFLGTPGWGTPRSMQPVLAGASDAKPAEPSIPVTPSAATPEPSPVAAAPAEPPEPRQKPLPAFVPAPVPAPAPAPVAAAPAQPGFDPLAPVSLESLPLLGKKSSSVPAPVSLNSLPPATSPPAAQRSSTSATGSKSKGLAASLEEPAPAAPARAKAKPEPAPAPEPRPAPVAAKPEPKGPKTTDPHPNDNPLQAAIRSAVRARPPKD